MQDEQKVWHEIERMRDRLAACEKEMSSISSWWFCQMQKGCEARPGMARDYEALGSEAREIRAGLLIVKRLLESVS